MDILTGLLILLGALAVAYPVYLLTKYIIKRREIVIAHSEAIERNAIYSYFSGVDWEEVNRQIRAVMPTIEEATEAIYLLAKAARQCH